MTNKNIIKNYNLDFGTLGIQIKFKDTLGQKDIRNIMYYFDNYILQLNNDYRLCKNIFDNDDNIKTINDIQN